MLLGAFLLSIGAFSQTQNGNEVPWVGKVIFDFVPTCNVVTNGELHMKAKYTLRFKDISFYYLSNQQIIESLEHYICENNSFPNYAEILSSEPILATVPR